MSDESELPRATREPAVAPAGTPPAPRVKRGRPPAAEQTVEVAAKKSVKVTIDGKYVELASGAPIYLASMVIAEVVQRVRKEKDAPKVMIGQYAHPAATAMRQDVVRQCAGTIEMGMWSALALVYIVELATCVVGYFIAQKASAMPPGALEAALDSPEAKEMMRGMGIDPDAPEMKEMLKQAASNVTGKKG